MPQCYKNSAHCKRGEASYQDADGCIQCLPKKTEKKKEDKKQDGTPSDCYASCNKGVKRFASATEAAKAGFSFGVNTHVCDMGASEQKAVLSQGMFPQCTAPPPPKQKTGAGPRVAALSAPRPKEQTRSRYRPPGDTRPRQPATVTCHDVDMALKACLKENKFVPGGETKCAALKEYQRGKC